MSNFRATRRTTIPCSSIFAIAACMTNVGCYEENPRFACSTNNECTMDGIVGQCEPNSLCSFPDPTCPSERRYGDLAPANEAQRCVPPDDQETTSAGQTGGGNATTDTPATTGDTSNPQGTGGGDDTTASGATMDDSGGSDGSGETVDDRTGDVLWAQSFGDPVDPVVVDTAVDVIHEIVLDPQGRIYVTGQYEGTMRIGDNTYVAEGGDDVWMASFTPEGVLRWSVAFGSPGHDSTGGIAIAPNGSVVISGALSGNPGFGDEPWEAGFHAYVGILDPMTGTPLRAVNVPGTSSRFMKVDVGFGGEIYAAGGFDGSVMLDDEYVSAGGEDPMFVRFDSDLNVTAAWVDGEGGDDLGRNMLMGRNGQLAVVGSHQQSEDSGEKSIFVAMFPEGLQPGGTPSPHWRRDWGSDYTRISKVHEVAFIEGTDLIVTGFVNEGVALGQTEPFVGGADDAFVMRLAGNNGDTIWAHTFGGADSDSALGLAVDHNDDVIVAGRTTVTDNLLGLPVDDTEGQRLFTMKLEADGTPVWAHRIGGDEYSSVEAVVVDAMGNGYAGGTYGATITLGDTTLEAAEERDALLFSFAP